MMNRSDFHDERSRLSISPELLIALAKMLERGESILPSSFYGQLPGY